MIETMTIGILALLVIAWSAVLAPRLGVAAPVLLVLIGLGVTLIPAVPVLDLDPELVLVGILPPLLYGAAVSVPTMDFRREFSAISSLSVPLVVVNALVLGALFAWLVPDLGFVWGVALGAIISPTDAVATATVKGTGVPRRALVLLEGEGLLNDASALVLLRTTIVAAAAAFSFWGAVGTFVYSVIVAVVFGALVGWGNLAIRQRVTDPTVNTIVSFTVPFAASIPAELLDGSGLVAAVVAGLVTGIRAPRVLPPRHRVSDAQNWAAVALVLEGTVFLTMGLQLPTIIAPLEAEHIGVVSALGVAAVALVALVVVRAAYVTPLLWGVSRRAHAAEANRHRFTEVQERIEAGTFPTTRPRRGGPRKGEPRTFDVARFAARIRRGIADIDYFVRHPLGVREGVVVVWAGMRGAVTVAAAQTLPESTPQRSLVVFLAFAIAIMSLLIQGGTIGLLAKRLFPGDAVDESDQDDRERVLALMRTAAEEVERNPEASEKEHRLAVLTAQRQALLDTRDDGLADAEVLAHALNSIDAEQIAIEMRGGPAG